MEATPIGLTFRQRLQQFFYAEEPPFSLALVRICLPLALLFPALPRWFHARELYSLDGAPTPLWNNYDYPGMLPIPSAPVAVALMSLYVVSLFTLSLGWKTRLSGAIATALGAYLGLLDAISTLTKFTCVATHALLLLTLSECGSLWSVDAWIAGRRTRWPGEINGGYRAAPVWPRRLLQAFLAVLYFGAAITKMQTPGFFSGDQMYFWLLADVNYANPLGKYATSWPPMMVLMGIGTIVWEIVFPFVCWRGLPKAGVLIFGVVFHLLTMAMLGLYAFPLICLSLYWAYFDLADIQGLAAWCRRRQREWRGAWAFVTRWRPWPDRRPEWMSPALSNSGFALTCALVIGAALEIERRMDVYGRTRPEGRFALTPMDPARAERMIGGLERVRYEDLWHSFDVGSQTLGGYLANRRTEFAYGDQAVVECCIVPPHGDLYVECNLHDDQNRLLQRSGQVMVREKIRTHFEYKWTEVYRPGAYDLVLMLNGNEVARRRVSVGPHVPAPDPSTATAMAR
jgi:hypothetical protein